jgi:hypothetical protein
MATLSRAKRLFWIRKLRGGAAFSLHIVAGSGTLDESLHLFLMGRGWLDEKGYKLSTPGQSLPTTALTVILETTDLFTALSAGQRTANHFDLARLGLMKRLKALP